MPHVHQRPGSVLLVLILGFGLAACGGDGPPAAPSPVGTAWGETVSGLALRLTLDQARYRAGDPITATVEAKNVGDEPLNLLAFEDRMWSYHVTFESLSGGPDFLGGAGVFVDHDKPRNATIASGAVWTREAKLTERGRRFLRIVPDRKPGDDWDYRDTLPTGRYQAWIAYTREGDADAFWSGSVRSNVLEVVVVPSGGPQ